MQNIALVVLRWAVAMFKQFPMMASTVVIMVIIMIIMIIYMAIHVALGIPIAISRVQQHYFSNYVGFPIDKPELDAQSISYGEVTITNISSKEKVILDIMLHDDDYKFDLEIRDLISGSVITMHLPAEYRGDQ
jgi:hypothetical protein